MSCFVKLTHHFMLDPHGCERRRMETVGSVLESSLGAGLSKRFAITSRILDLWPAILPRYLAESCIPTQLVNGVLTVETPSSSYSFDLRCESSNILARLHQEFGSKVRRLSIISAGTR